MLFLPLIASSNKIYIDSCEHCKEKKLEETITTLFKFNREKEDKPYVIRNPEAKVLH